MSSYLTIFRAILFLTIEELDAGRWMSASVWHVYEGYQERKEIKYSITVV
jgi:hypothetical protein